MSGNGSDTFDSAMAAGAQAQAAQRARDAQDAALADAALAGADVGGGDAGSASPQSPATPPPAPAAPARPQGLKRIDDPGELHTDDFGLGGDLNKMVTDALEAAFADEIIKDDNSGTATKPAPDATTSASADGDGGGAGTDGGGAATTPTADATPPPPPPTPDDFSLDTYARDYFGTNLDRQTAQNLFGVLGGLQNATPEQRQEIDRILSGRAMPQVPAAPAPVPQQYATNGGVVQGVQMPPIPTPSTLPPRPTDDYPDEQRIYDQFIAPLAATQQAQLDAIRADIDRTTQHQINQQRAAEASRIDAASTSWRDSHAILTDGEFDALTQRVVQSGTFPALLQAHHGDVSAATNAIYEQHFWADPNLRARALANQASNRDPITGTPTPDASTAQLEAGRRALASSVAGGGGHQPARSPAPPANKEQRRGAMLSEIAAAMEPAP